MSYTVEAYPHPDAPKGGKRWQLMSDATRQRCAKGTVDASGVIITTSGAVPDDAADWFEEACRKAAGLSPAPIPTPPARPVALPAPAHED